MAIEQIFDSASSIMTLVSFITFCGILLWTFALRKNADFAVQAALPFADDAADEVANQAAHQAAHQATHQATNHAANKVANRAARESGHG